MMWKNFFEDIIKRYYEKYREIFWYLVCGAGTTVVNLISFWCFGKLLHLPTVLSTCGAWILSVSFAYLTNRTFVFQSKHHSAQEILREIGTFFGARICSGVLDVLLMVIFVDVLHFPQMWTKIGVNVLVTVLNYIASKWIVFSGKQNLREDKTYVAEN